VIAAAEPGAANREADFLPVAFGGEDARGEREGIFEIGGVFVLEAVRIDDRDGSGHTGQLLLRLVDSRRGQCAGLFGGHNDPVHREGLFRRRFRRRRCGGVFGKGGCADKRGGRRQPAREEGMHEF